MRPVATHLLAERATAYRNLGEGPSVLHPDLDHGTYALGRGIEALDEAPKIF
jgi:hypothetical protein